MRTPTGVALGVLAALALGERSAEGAPSAKDAEQGLALAKSGNCVDAVPLLEAVEANAHRPATAAALAGCQAALGELVLARDIYRSLSAETPNRTWLAADRKAHDEAAKKADALDARIPTVELVLPDALPDDLEVRIGDKVVSDLHAPIPVAAEEKLRLVASAAGYDPDTEAFLLHEGEHRHISIVLLKKGETPPPKKAPATTESGAAWLIGARFRGMLIPTFVMNIFADGGTTVYEPGIGLTLTRAIGRLEIEPAIQYTYYGLPPTPFKGKGAPDTEWEIAEANLHSLVVSVDFLYGFPLDPGGIATFRLGGGLGVGAMFAGDMFRTKAYPPNLKPGDPSTYVKCKGPDNPPGSFRYCNSLDKDKNLYGQPEQPWGAGGLRPVVYPWVALPELELSIRPIKKLSLDIETGLTLSGFLTGFGARYQL